MKKHYLKSFIMSIIYIYKKNIIQELRFLGDQKLFLLIFSYISPLEFEFPPVLLAVSFFSLHFPYLF